MPRDIASELPDKPVEYGPFRVEKLEAGDWTITGPGLDTLYARYPRRDSACLAALRYHRVYLEGQRDQIREYLAESKGPPR